MSILHALRFEDLSAGSTLSNHRISMRGYPIKVNQRSLPNQARGSIQKDGGALQLST